MIDDKKLYRAIGQAIKRLRNKEELNQSQFAERIGLERTSITNIESGNQKVTVAVLFRILEKFNIDDLSSLLPKVGEVSISESASSSEEHEIDTGEGVTKVGSKTFDAIQRIRNG
jgi:transcriptional regulator with XRE-family HTH domain